MFTCFPEDLFKDKSAHLDRWRLVKRAFFENCTESHAVLQSERIANDVQQTSKNRSLWQIRNNFRMTKLPKEDLQFPWTRAMRKSKRVSLHQGKFSFRESSSGDAGNKSRCKEQQFSGKCCIRQSSEVKTKGILGNNINMQDLLPQKCDRSQFLFYFFPSWLGHKIFDILCLTKFHSCKAKVGSKVAP